MKSAILNLTVSVALVLGLTGLANASEQNVFGNDGRTEMTSASYPWSAIGKFMIGTDGWCTGTLVSKKLVLTNAHCVLDESTGAVSPDVLTFYPNFKNGSGTASATVVHVWYGTTDIQNDAADDWALALLDQDLGTQFGTMGVETVSYAAEIDNLQLAGYGSDFDNGDTAGVDANCSIMQLATDGSIYHDCSTWAGNSGSALFHCSSNTSCSIVGLNRGGFTDSSGNRQKGVAYSSDTANIGVQTTKFLPTLQSLISQGD